MAITAARTASLINAYGADAVFHTDTATFNPVTSETTRTGAATHTHKVVEEGRQDLIRGDADMLIYVSPDGMTFTPTVQGRVEYKARTWIIVSVKPVVFQGVTVLYEIGFKGVAL